jgi:hypothetical protein
MIEYIYRQEKENTWLIIAGEIQMRLCGNSQPGNYDYSEAHAQMISDFEDIEKLENFVQMLAADSNTAFMNYISANHPQLL